MMFAQNILRIPEGSPWVLPGKAIMKKVTKFIFHFGSKWHFQICGSFLEQLSVSFLLVNTTFFHSYNYHTTDISVSINMIIWMSDIQNLCIN